MAVVGIDLGTTASIIACVKDGVPFAVPVNGNITTPSVVGYADGEVVVGREAIINSDKDSAVFSVKRAMGSEKKFFGRKSVEVSADILSYLKKNAEENLGNKIDSAVITVPAHFSDLQRVATKQAASIAGIKVLRLINEPTAAAIAFGLDKRSSGIFAVYDFGGGTFDFSVLRLLDGIFQVLATGGDNHLGGDDIDNAILDYNLKICKIDVTHEENSAKLTAKFLKENLQDLLEIKINYTDNCEFRLSHKVLKELSQQFIQKSLLIADQVLKDARIKVGDLGGIVMVGGMTKLKIVKDEVKNHFRANIFDDINPEEAVALGAAIYADSLVSKSSNMLLIDVISLTLGVETLGGGVDKIIHRNTPIPIVEQREYTTYQDNQTGIMFHVVQGERPVASECRSLARFELSGIPPMPAGIPRVLVKFSVDVNGLLSISAQEQKTGLTQTIVVDPSSGLSNEEIVAILKKAMAKRNEDSIQARNITVKIESERMIKFWESIINEIPSSEQEIAKSELVLLKKALKFEQYSDAIDHKKTLENIFGQFLDDIINSHLSGKQLLQIC
ncbi:MAG: Hsp70 family protein [Holosporaceae bacterium]|jgi:molecular chaperone HscA|nr:Hsp70 family protein [Holosporaceae bacterium]